MDKEKIRVKIKIRLLRLLKKCLVELLIWTNDKMIELKLRDVVYIENITKDEIEEDGEEVE